MNKCFKSIYLANKIACSLQWSYSVRRMRMQSTYANAMLQKMSKDRNGKKVEVDGVPIFYEIAGNGDHPVLLIHGALCSTTTDFDKQFQGLNLEKFTLIGLDLPGCGLSRPPERKFSIDMFENDAIIAHKFMKALNYDRFSVFGWSANASTAINVAAKFPQSVRKLAVSAPLFNINPQALELFEKIRDVAHWSLKRIMVGLFYGGQEGFHKNWENFIQTSTEILDKRNGVLCPEIQLVACPTLILFGGTDWHINWQHPLSIKKQIKHSRLRIYTNAGHPLHSTHSKQFNKDLQEFLED